MSTIEMFKRLVILNPTKSTTELVNEAESLESVRRQIDKLAGAEKRLRDEFKAKLNDLERDRRSVRQDCSHALYTYYPDPSGNNDSHTTCDICGASI